MTKMKKWLANLLFGIFTVLSICNFTACETNKTGTGENVNSVYGTYYPYYMGELIDYDQVAITIKPNGVCELVYPDNETISGTYTQNGDVFFLDVEFEFDTFGEVVIANGVLQQVGWGGELFCKKGAKINEIWGSYEKIDDYNYGSYESEYCTFFSNGTWRLTEYLYDFNEGTSTDTVLWAGTYTIEENWDYDISMRLDEEFENLFPEGNGVKFYANYDNDVIELYMEGVLGEFHGNTRIGKYAKEPWEYNDNY